MEFVYLLRLLAAIVAGAVVGFERELHDKPAGFRTNILICFGAALFTVMSVHFGNNTLTDSSRIAAQIVTGVGFLGAGTIIHFKANVLGLTTAATIWAVASVGMAFGAGEYLVGSVAALMTAGILHGLSYVEEQIASWRETANYEIKLTGGAESAARVRDLASQNNVRIRGWSLTKADETIKIHVNAVAPAKDIGRFQNALIDSYDVSSLRRI